MVDEHIDLECSNPFTRTNERSRFIIHLHQQGLDLLVARNLLLPNITILHQPRQDRHEGSIRTTPSLVVETILHVMMKDVVSPNTVPLTIL